MKTSPHIVKMRPHLVEKVWGGRRLQTQFGKALSAQGPYGEAWEVADLDEGQSYVASGPLAGLPLRALSEGWQRGLVGNRAPRSDRFPLLIKLLDAAQDLSVQVHPGPEDVPNLEGARSKEETWLILDSEPGASIVHGLKEDGIEATRFRAAAADGELEGLLRRVEVEAGDVVDVVPKTIHAICAGVALLEIQEPSDTTYRVYDYDRPGLDGTPRQLHLDEALQVGRLERSSEVIKALPGDDPRDVARCVTRSDAYRVERLTVEKPSSLQWHVDPDSPQVLHVLDGTLVLEDGIGGTVTLQAYESAVVPAIVGCVKAEFRGPGRLIGAGLAVEQLMRDLRVTPG